MKDKYVVAIVLVVVATFFILVSAAFSGFERRPTSAGEEIREVDYSKVLAQRISIVSANGTRVF